MKLILSLCVTLLFAGFQLKASEPLALQIKVLDIWSGQPVQMPFAIMQGDTVYGNAVGTLHLTLKCTRNQTVRIQARGYFAETVNCRSLKAKIIYLTPVRQTPFITVIRSKIPSSPLNIPSHQSYVNIQAQPVLGENVADVLQGQSGVFIKSYGPGAALKTVAIRSMSAEQTQVSFDGIPLNNLQLGSTDLSQLPIDDLAGIELYRGSNVLLGGSGAIGGSINLEPLQPAGQFVVRSRFGYSTLKNKQISSQMHLPLFKRRLRTLLTFSHANGLNRYTTDFQGQKADLRDRDFLQNHLSYQMIYAPSGIGQVKFFVSHFKRHAGAPHAFTNPTSEMANAARMSWDNTLTYLRWQRDGKKAGFYAQLYVRNEWMAYRDPNLLVNYEPLHSLHFNKEQGLQVRFHYSPRQALLFKSGVEMANQAVNSSQAGKHHRQRQAVYLLVDWLAFESPSTSQAFHLNGGVRFERYGSGTAVVMPVVGLGYNYKRTQLYANAGRNYRVPGFNDLYWVPGGNPNLRPELSFNMESGVRQNWPVARWLAQIEIGLYQNDVHDKIRWVPGQAGYWTPRNIAKVRSRGIEIDLRWSHVNGIHKLRFSYSFGRATKQSAETPNDRTVGNQLPYLPQEQWSLSAQSGWHRWRTGIWVQRTGFRYLDFSNDPGAILPAFTTVRWWLRSEFALGSMRIVPEISVENLTDRRYEVLTGFPMPGRYVRLGCLFEFKARKDEQSVFKK